MKSINIALTCVMVLASQTGICQAVLKPPPATATLSSGPPMQMGSVNDHEIQKLNMELAKAKTEFAQELAKVKKDIAALTDQLAASAAKYKSHTHDYSRATYDFGAVKAKCGWGGKECDPVIWYNQYSPRVEKDQVSTPNN